MPPAGAALSGCRPRLRTFVRTSPALIRTGRRQRRRGYGDNRTTDLGGLEAPDETVK